MGNVVTYTNDRCQYCHTVKDYMDENNVEYTERGISQDQEARRELMKKGHMDVLVTTIGGEEIVGFDQAKLEETLGLQKNKNYLSIDRQFFYAKTHFNQRE